MSLNLKRLSLANARLEMLTRIEADLHAQFLELTELRERLREAQLSADLQTRRGPESPRQLLSPHPPSVSGNPLAVALSVRSAPPLHVRHLSAGLISNPASISRWMTISAACSGSRISAGKSARRCSEVCAASAEVLAKGFHRGAKKAWPFTGRNRTPVESESLRNQSRA